MADQRRSHHAAPRDPADGTPDMADPQYVANPATGVYEPMGGHQADPTEDSTRAPEPDYIGEPRGEAADPEAQRRAEDARWRPAASTAAVPYMTPEEEAAFKRFQAAQAEQADWLPAPPLGRPPEEHRARAFYPQPEDGAVYEVMVDTLGSGHFILEKGDRFTADQMAQVHRHQATGARVGAGTKGAGPAYDLPWLLHTGAVALVGRVAAEPAGRRHRERDD